MTRIGDRCTLASATYAQHKEADQLAVRSMARFVVPHSIEAMHRIVPYGTNYCSR